MHIEKHFKKNEMHIEKHFGHIEKHSSMCQSVLLINPLQRALDSTEIRSCGAAADLLLED